MHMLVLVQEHVAGDSKTMMQSLCRVALGPAGVEILGSMFCQGLAWEYKKRECPCLFVTIFAPITKHVWNMQQVLWKVLLSA